MLRDWELPVWETHSPSYMGREESHGIFQKTLLILPMYVGDMGQMGHGRCLAIFLREEMLH